MADVTVVDGAVRIGDVRRLFREYGESLGVDLSFQRFDEEVAELPGVYAPPRGRLLLALARGEPAGCVALRPLRGSDCEMKRLYVRPPFRGIGLGRRLVTCVIDEARQLGYRRMLLDTLAEMTAAQALYAQFGFTESDAYTPNPVAGARFMQLALADAPTGLPDRPDASPNPVGE